MRSYYRVFYWMYSLSLKTNAFRDNKPMSAFISAFMFSYFLVMDLAIIETSLKYFGIDVRQFYERIVFHIVSGCILTVNLFVFLYKKRYLTIEERFQDEDKRRKRLYNILCFIYSFVSFFGVVILGCFFGNPWIK